MEDDSIAEVADPIPSIPPNIPENAELIKKVAASVATISIENSEQDLQLMKQSCHDSGIDIRDPNLPVVLNTKKNYSDADIVLSSDWVPPITIAPTDYTDTQSRSQDTRLNAGGTSLTEPTVVGRKKTSSVSFSVDDNTDSQHHHSTSSDKTSDNNKKNKMLKRLSYPLTGLIEGLSMTGDDKLRSDSAESAPNTGDSNQSVFSKVFSRYALKLLQQHI